MTPRFFAYRGIAAGPDGRLAEVDLYVDLETVVAIHVFASTVYLEGESVSWTLHRAEVDTVDLLDRWATVRAA